MALVFYTNIKKNTSSAGNITLSEIKIACSSVYLHLSQISVDVDNELSGLIGPFYPRPPSMHGVLI